MNNRANEIKFESIEIKLSLIMPKEKAHKIDTSNRQIILK